MSESREINPVDEKPKSAASAPAAGCFGIESSTDLHEAERLAASKRDCPSLEEFADHYFHLGFTAGQRTCETKIVSKH